MLQPWGQGCGRCCGSGLGCRSRGGCAGSDDGQLATDLDGVVFLRIDLEQDSGDGGRDLCVDLVGRDFEQRLVDGNLVADSLEPTGDGAFGDGLAEGGHRHGGTFSGTARSGGCLGSGSFFGGSFGSRRFLGGSFLCGGGGCLCRGCCGFAGFTDLGELATDFHGVVFLRDDLGQDAGDGRRNLGVDLVRGDFEQGFVDFDRVSFLLEPPCDSSLGDALT